MSRTEMEKFGPGSTQEFDAASGPRRTILKSCIAERRNLGSCLPQAAEEGFPRSTDK
jgi:hypothetical protein